MQYAPYASDPARSRGRFTPEPESATRTPFQRDRDRVIHSTAFRRLKDKTQVFVYHEGDHFRTRLTHSLEVAQVARSISRTLRLNEDLTEALALAHDLGHPPFGHAGERALDRCLRDFGGFDHNAQALRIVTRLERQYAGFDGLNLTWETLEGLVKHNGPLVDEKGRPAGRYEKTGLPDAIARFEHSAELELATFAGAEAQTAAIADDIAYNAHDIDDGLRARLFDISDLAGVPLVGEALAQVAGRWPGLERARMIHETVRVVIGAMAGDVLDHAADNLAGAQVCDARGIRALGRPAVKFSPQMVEKNRVLQQFLYAHMYRHEKVVAITGRARRIVCDLFECYMNSPQLLPPGWLKDGEAADESRLARRAGDFLAGMTDRYALDQHRQLFDLEPLFR